MDDDQQFCLRWNNHQSTLISVFDTLLENETLVDCTLAAEGKFLKAHKVVLSACSPYFATLLQEQYDKHPIFILKDVKYQELRAMMDYMYRGEVNISQDQLAALLKAAESLQIKGLSDSRSGAPKPEHHRGLNVPGSSGSGKLSAGYTLEQTQSKRARIGPSSMESQDMSGSREGSSSPSRRRRKVRRRSIENAMADVHDNSNSSQIQSNQPSLLQQQQQQQSNASLAGVGAITAAASALASQLPVSAATLPTGSSGVAAAAAAAAIASTQGTTTSVTKKTESVKGTSDAMNTENVQSGSAIGADDQSMEHVKGDKQNHKQKSTSAAGKEQAELVIEPKSEYDEEGNEETVEDLTLDDEEMGMEDLDQNAGTSQGGEGSSQGYAPWQHDRSQDELLLATQEAQQRDPQVLVQTGAVTPTSSQRRHSLRMKTSPLSSPIGTPSGVIKYEPSGGDEHENGRASINVPTTDAAAIVCEAGSSGIGAVGVGVGEGEDDDQPCDLRLSSLRINLVSMALQQAAAAAAAAGDPSAMAAMMSGSSASASTGMPTPQASKLQQAALQSIAAVASTATPSTHLSLINFPHAHTHQQHPVTVSVPVVASQPARAITPTRRYSSSTSSGGIMPSGVPSSSVGGRVTSPSSSNAAVIVGTPGTTSTTSASTSAAVAGGTSHTPSVGGGGGAGGAAATSSSGAGGSGGGGGAGPTSGSWGGAYTCDRCGNSYARPHSLNRHVRFECGVEPKFECPICHKKSKHKHNLVLHMRTHQHR